METESDSKKKYVELMLYIVESETVKRTNGKWWWADKELTDVENLLEELLELSDEADKRADDQSEA